MSNSITSHEITTLNASIVLPLPYRLVLKNAWGLSKRSDVPSALVPKYGRCVVEIRLDRFGLGADDVRLAVRQLLQICDSSLG